MRKLLLLVDSDAYIRENCYQHQLYETLQKVFSVTSISIRQMRWNPLINVDAFDIILSVLKQRTIYKYVDNIRCFLKGRPVYIYDQDPWQALIDGSPTKGCYKEFQNKFNLKTLLLTSQWWTNFCTAQGFPSRFVRMGMLPKYCEVGPAWNARPIHLGFQGTIHAHRKKFFDDLASMNLKVTVLPSAPYKVYLSALHTMQIYIHTENAPWMVEGTLTPRNALWIKDIEVTARGCFAIRDWDEDWGAYNIAELPSILTFRDITQIPELIESINSLSDNERRQLIHATVETIRNRDDWKTIIQALD